MGRENRNEITAGANGKTALVTGASSGMGLHYAAQLAGYGYNVILVSNQAEQIKEAAHKIAGKYNCVCIDEAEKTIDNIDKSEEGKGKESCTEHSIKQWITGIYKDLSDPHAAEELFVFCQKNSIEVEVLINNAGIFFFKDIIDCNINKVATIINLHVYTSTMLCRLFGEKMRERKRGYILNMSSISVHTPYPAISLYTATKSYIRTMTKAFRLEMKEFGVRVMVVSPGAVATDLYNLPANLQQLGIRLGVIYRPEKLVGKALKKLFYTNKKEFVPGAVNHLFKPIYSLLPEWFKMWARKKTARFKNK